MLRRFKAALRAEGPRGLYRGFQANLTGGCASWGFYFLFYTLLKRQLQANPSATEHLSCSALAGVATAAITNPLWVVKTRMCTQTLTTSDPYRNLADALVRIGREEGPRGLYRGFVPALFGVSHGAIQFMVYEQMKQFVQQKYADRNLLDMSTGTGIGMYLTMAASSKTIATSVTYPYQVIRSRMQDRLAQYAGVFDVTKRVWMAGGVRGFYRGLAPNLLRVVPGTCITFATYEWLSSLFRRNSK